MLKFQTQSIKCPICQKQINRWMMNTLKLNCGHYYHNACYKQLVINGLDTCSICREKLKLVTWKTKRIPIKFPIIKIPVINCSRTKKGNGGPLEYPKDYEDLELSDSSKFTNCDNKCNTIQLMINLLVIILFHLLLIMVVSLLLKIIITAGLDIEKGKCIICDQVYLSCLIIVAVIYTFCCGCCYCLTSEIILK